MEALLLKLVVALLGLILVSLWLVLYQLMKQQGRMLLRLDHLDHQGAHAGQGARAQPVGLPVGTQIASFRLPDLTGKEVALEDFRGKQVLLVNWSPHCGFCDRIAPDLAKLQPDLQKRNVHLLLVSSGKADANRRLVKEHALECPILLQKEGSSLEPFKGLGTPVAYLVDEQGRVAEPIAVGAEQVPALAHAAAAGRPKKKRLFSKLSAGESRIERGGLKAGTPAPSFRLRDIYGRTVSLDDYRGRRVLLVFSDPHCGPCDELAPDLVRLHREHRDNNLAVVMVGRGEVEENRRKAEAHGFEFPVVLQERWKLSKEYGIFATPVAFLIGEDGVIARNLARGPDGILALARQELAADEEVGNGRPI